MSFLPIAFASPWMLLGLAALPLLWLIIRLVPPRPRRIDFPPLRLLLELAPRQETAARTPWWLILLRLGLAAALILALAGPIWNPTPTTASGTGPLIVVLDNGWPAARDWERRVAAATAAINGAGDEGRGVALIATADPVRETGVATSAQALDRLRVLKPQPIAPDRTPHLATIQRLVAENAGSSIVWYADGLALGEARPFAEGLTRIADTSGVIVHVDQARTARALAAAANRPGALEVEVLRADTGQAESGVLRAFDLRGRSLTETAYTFDPGATEVTARFDAPVELRNEVARVEIADEHAAGAVRLLDERFRRRKVGLVTGATADVAQPLLAPTYYVSRALEPFADIDLANGAGSAEAIDSFIKAKLPVMMLADVGTISGDTKEALEAWIRDGGVLVRFAGSRLAAATDDLVPVRLRRGGRILGGALAWEKPQALGGFTAGSPFAGLPVPDDVTVTRQVLAEPDGDLQDKTWATLADGTPLVTAARQGKGLVVLFHVTADTTWSNLPISGTFVEMLRRIIALSGTVAAADDAAAEAAGAPAAARAGEATLAPTRTLDGFGAFGAPPPTAKPVPAEGRTVATADHPPGIYGPPDGFVAVNTLAPGLKLERLDLSNLPVTVAGYTLADPLKLAPPLFVAALIALIVDTFVMFAIAGLGRRLPNRRAGAAAALALVAALAAMAPPPARAQSGGGSEEFALRASLATRLAYVTTGSSEVDETSRAGLTGLTKMLASRTAFEAKEPIAVDVARDELAFFPLIYWPIVPEAPLPSREALARVDAFMKQGGTILFDTRDALLTTQGASSGPGAQALARILASLDVPELEPVPKDHVVTKSFYLLTSFPGRYANGEMWVEALPAASDDGADRPARSGDGVSPIIITSNDFAGAWAIDSSGQPIYPTQGTDPRQREMAYRVGINIVMYALTGNYKADQVHVPALLERLGQ